MGSTLEPGQVVAGRYRVEGQIGEGGMGSVYLVQHVHTDERLAMKVLHAQVLRDEDAVQRFRREARAPARIASEHVARVTDADTAPELEGAPFIVMELLRGKDLEELARGGPLSPTDVVEYMRQAARALDKAHGMGIVHRDLKPENLFLTQREDGSPCIKLLDFGIARIADIEVPQKMKTQSGAVFGTPAYMSPEQTMGNVDAIGPPTDIWALGLIVFRLLIGKDYWQAPTVAQLYVELLTAPLATPSSRGSTLGVTFDTWFAACVVRDRDMRFKTAGDAVAALATALGLGGRAMLPSFTEAQSTPSLPWPPEPASGIPSGIAPSHASEMMTDAPSTSTPPSLDGREKRSNFAAAVVGALALLGAIGLALVYFLRSEAPPPLIPTVSVEAPAGEQAAPPQPAKPTPTAPIATAPVVSPGTSASAAPPPDSAAPPSETAAPAPEPAPKSHAQEPHASGKMPRTETKSEDAPPAAKEPTSLSADQRGRLDVLKRLCDSGTFAPSECANKRAAIMHGSN